MLFTLLALTVTFQAAVPTEVPAGMTVPIAGSIWTTSGSAIPDIELPRVDGKGLVRLKNYEGKRLLLIQFASW